MTYQETVEFLFSQLPMFQRTGAAAYKPNLDRIEGILKAIGNPEAGLRYVHVAGTNGKGSVCSLCSAMLQTAGYKTGLFTSPHFVDYRERIRVNGQMIPEDYIVGFVSENQSLIEEWQPSFFEWTTAIAFAYFKESACDIVVLETGMGGRLDSTNVVIPEVAAITSIGLDHQEFLGNTMLEIAGEKAGIMKSGRSTIIGSQNPEIQSFLVNHANSIDATPVVIQSDPPSDWEQLNFKIVNAIREVLTTRGFDISDHNLVQAKNHVSELTGYWGRFQKLGNHPTVLADTAHNEQAIAALLSRIKDVSHKELIVIYGTTHGHQIRSQLALFPKSTKFILTTTDLPRMLQREELIRAAEDADIDFQFAVNPISALEKAKALAYNEDLILICGSVFLTAAYHPQNNPTKLG